MEAARKAGLGEYDFVPEIIDDILYECNEYDDPERFFKELSEYGCQSGMVGKFIYNSDCKDFYVQHIDSMEEFVEWLEDETGAPIRNDGGQSRYTFMCWLCYEEVAYRTAQILWPDDF